LTPHRPPGLYEELVTLRLEVALEEIHGEGWHREIIYPDPAEAPGAPADLVTKSGEKHRPAIAESINKT